MTPTKKIKRNFEDPAAKSTQKQHDYSWAIGITLNDEGPHCEQLTRKALPVAGVSKFIGYIFFNKFFRQL